MTRCDMRLLSHLKGNLCILFNCIRNSIRIVISVTDEDCRPILRNLEVDSLLLSFSLLFARLVNMLLRGFFGVCHNAYLCLQFRSDNNVHSVSLDDTQDSSPGGPTAAMPPSASNRDSDLTRMFCNVDQLMDGSDYDKQAAYKILVNKSKNRQVTQRCYHRKQASIAIAVVNCEITILIDRMTDQSIASQPSIKTSNYPPIHRFIHPSIYLSIYQPPIH